MRNPFTSNTPKPGDLCFFWDREGSGNVPGFFGELASGSEGRWVPKLRDVGWRHCSKTAPAFLKREAANLGKWVRIGRPYNSNCASAAGLVGQVVWQDGNPKNRVVMVPGYTGGDAGPVDGSGVVVDLGQLTEIPESEALGEVEAQRLRLQERQSARPQVGKFYILKSETSQALNGFEVGDTVEVLVDDGGSAMSHRVRGARGRTGWANLEDLGQEVPKPENWADRPAASRAATPAAAWDGLLDAGRARREPLQFYVPSDSESSKAPKVPEPLDEERCAAAWARVKGQEQAKAELREAVEIPLKHADLYAAYGKKPSKGVLLYGPPGCGKTMLGRAMAEALGLGEDGFVYIKTPEFYQGLVGAGEEKMREIFEEASSYKKRTGKPQVLFFDEADAVLKVRGDANNGMTSSAVSVTNTFLTELDGLEESGAFVILATNRPEVLDPAVIRDGRIDRKVKVDRPSQEVVGDVIRAALEKAPGFDERLVTLAVDRIWDPKLCYYLVDTEDRGTVRVEFRHQVSGAVAAGIAERTLNEALRRDVAAGSKVPSGICEADVLAAVDGSWCSTLDLDLTWLLQEVVGALDISTIRAVCGRAVGFRKVGEQKVKLEVSGIPTPPADEDEPWNR